MCESLLKKFDFDPEFGFVIKSPLEKLDRYFDPWLELVTNIEALRAQPEIFREKVRCVSSLSKGEWVYVLRSTFLH